MGKIDEMSDDELRELIPEDKRKTRFIIGAFQGTQSEFWIKLEDLRIDFAQRGIDIRIKKVADDKFWVGDNELVGWYGALDAGRNREDCEFSLWGDPKHYYAQVSATLEKLIKYMPLEIRPMDAIENAASTKRKTIKLVDSLQRTAKAFIAVWEERKEGVDEKGKDLLADIAAMLEKCDEYIGADAVKKRMRKLYKIFDIDTKKGGNTHLYPEELYKKLVDYFNNIYFE